MSDQNQCTWIVYERWQKCFDFLCFGKHDHTLPVSNLLIESNFLFLIFEFPFL